MPLHIICYTLLKSELHVSHRANEDYSVSIPAGTGNLFFASLEVLGTEPQCYYMDRPTRAHVITIVYLRSPGPGGFTCYASAHHFDNFLHACGLWSVQVTGGKPHTEARWLRCHSSLVPL